MSLYRVAGGGSRKLLAALATVSLLVGGVVGFATGRATEEPPTLAELASDTTGDLQPALNALELVTIEYPQSVRDGRIVAETEFEAARSHADTAVRTLVANEADLRTLAAEPYDLALGALRELDAAITRREDPERVAELARQARRRVTALAGTEDG